MSRYTATLLSENSKHWNMTGEPTPASSYFYGGRSNHTIMIHAIGFKGRVYIEASLTQNPTENDWFPVDLVDGPFIEFPLDNLSPKQINDGYNIYRQFNVKAAWIRARIDRDYLAPKPREELFGPYGAITKILLSY